MTVRSKTVLVVALRARRHRLRQPNTRTTCSTRRQSRRRPPSIAATHDIFVATTRQTGDKDQRAGVRRRSFADHQLRPRRRDRAEGPPGRRHRARQGSANSNPAKDFTATDVIHYDGAPQFAKAVGADIAMRGDRALVFVHGFNNGFDDGVYRLTQIAHDTKYPGTPVLFSWASSGKTTRLYLRQGQRQRRARRPRGDARHARQDAGSRASTSSPIRWEPG